MEILKKPSWDRKKNQIFIGFDKFYAEIIPSTSLSYTEHFWGHSVLLLL